MSNILRIKKIAAIVAFIITITIAMIFIDYSDLNFKTNLWQYSMIIISALGIIMILSDKKFTDNKKKKATIIDYSMVHFFIVFHIYYSIIYYNERFCQPYFLGTHYFDFHKFKCLQHYKTQ